MNKSVCIVPLAEALINQGFQLFLTPFYFRGVVEKWG